MSVTKLTDQSVPEAAGPMELVRLAVRFNLHPEVGVHPSWLPESWPAGYRNLSRYNGSAQSLLGKYLMRWGALDDCIEFKFDSRIQRLALIDSASLRMVAAYCGLCAHKPLFEMVSTSHDMHRLAKRMGPDTAQFVLSRTPALTGLVLSKRLAPTNPLSLGSLVMNRGYRMLLGVFAAEGDRLLRRVVRKLPRRVSLLKIPAFRGPKVEQISELIFLCLVPEKVPQWDWLF